MVLREIHGPRNARMRMQDCPENDREQKAAINLDCYGSFRTPVPKPTHCELPPQRTGGIPKETHPGETLGEAFLSLQMAADGEVALYRRGTDLLAIVTSFDVCLGPILFPWLSAHRATQTL
jgi:hypothetical protein